MWSGDGGLEIRKTGGGLIGSIFVFFTFFSFSGLVIKRGTLGNSIVSTGWDLWVVIMLIVLGDVSDLLDSGLMGNPVEVINFVKSMGIFPLHSVKGWLLMENFFPYGGVR